MQIDPHDLNDMLIRNGLINAAIGDACHMLTDALHALRNGHTDVTQEFIDRTITNLARLRQ